jgi:hypothetical protein
MKIILDIDPTGLGDVGTFKAGDSVSLYYSELGDTSPGAERFFATVTVDGFKRDGRGSSRLCHTSKDADPNLLMEGK